MLCVGNLAGISDHANNAIKTCCAAGMADALSMSLENDFSNKFISCNDSNTSKYSDDNKFNDTFISKFDYLVVCRKNANSTCYTVLNVWSNRLFNKGCIDTLKSNASILSDEQMLKNNKVINYYRIILLKKIRLIVE